MPLLLETYLCECCYTMFYTYSEAEYCEKYNHSIAPYRK